MARDLFSTDTGRDDAVLFSFSCTNRKTHGENRGESHSNCASDGIGCHGEREDGLGRPENKNYDLFGSYLASDSIEVEPDGVYDKSGSVKGVAMFDFSKAELSEWKTVKF